MYTEGLLHSYDRDNECFVTFELRNFFKASERLSRKAPLAQDTASLMQSVVPRGISTACSTP